MGDTALSLVSRTLGQARLADPAVGGKFERGRPLAGEEIVDPLDAPAPPPPIDEELLMAHWAKLPSSWDGLLGTLLRSRQSQPASAKGASTGARAERPRGIPNETSVMAPPVAATTNGALDTPAPTPPGAALPTDRVAMQAESATRSPASPVAAGPSAEVAERQRSGPGIEVTVERLVIRPPTRGAAARLAAPVLALGEYLESRRRRR